jgi:hypothetical protein
LLPVALSKEDLVAKTLMKGTLKCSTIKFSTWLQLSSIINDTFSNEAGIGFSIEIRRVVWDKNIIQGA